jgi:hypothetical protein
MKKLQVILFTLALFAGALTASLGQINNGTAPYVFSTGTTIRASEMNSNFSSLYSDSLDRTGGTVTGAIASSGGSLTGSWAGSPTFTGAPTINQLTLSGGQLVFPATQAVSTNANTLDDYEEGTWTPVLGGVTSASGQTYSTQAGYYQKVGRWVHVSGVVALTAKGTNSGNIGITGLPFQPDINSGAVAVGYWASLTTAVSHLAGFTQAGQSYALLYYATGDDASLTALTAADLSDTTDVRFSISYRTGS